MIKAKGARAKIFAYNDARTFFGSVRFARSTQ